MIRADTGRGRRASRARDAMAPVLRFTRDSGVYRVAVGRAREPLSAVRRARGGARAPRRPDRPRAAVRPRRPTTAARRCGGCSSRSATSTRSSGFDNRRGVFPIHRSVRFLLLTATQRHADRPRSRAGSASDDPAVLETVGDEPADASPWFPVRVTPALLERLSGDGPRAARPAARRSISRSSSAPRRSFRRSAARDGWGARFGRELNATDDRGAFRATAGDGLPIVEGKHIEPFRVALDGVAPQHRAARRARLLRRSRHQRPRLAYRDVASATNRLTLIAAVLPAGCVSTHTVFCLRTPLPLARSALPVRPVQQLRRELPGAAARDDARDDGDGRAAAGAAPPRRAPTAAREIAALSRHLSRRPDPAALARLNARVAELYQLSAEEFVHILATFPLIVPPNGERR